MRVGSFLLSANHFKTLTLWRTSFEMWWWSSGGIDEPSSSVGLYFRIFAHFGSRVTLTVTLLSSQCYYCPAEVILLFSAFNFNFAFLFFFVFCHTVACVMADVTAKAIVTFAELCEISPFSLFRVAFFFFLFYYFWLFVNFAFTFS